jgi:2-polyprenyl-6-methoxyphenol hydroxylase-like FAD-dependent oxidoreductase
VNPADISVRCCIAGGGPAGMMLGFLLARAGIPVMVLEKHSDFLRDFRGDTIHPSTLEIIHELGLLEEFLRRPHQPTRTVGVQIGEDFVRLADFAHLPTRCRFIAMMPQWDFLNFVAEHARQYPEFQLKLNAEVTDLLLEGAQVTGLRATTADGELTVRADLVIGADGRHSTVRARSGLEIVDICAPMDALWMRCRASPAIRGTPSSASIPAEYS